MPTTVTVADVERADDVGDGGAHGAAAARAVAIARSSPRGCAATSRSCQRRGGRPHGPRRRWRGRSPRSRGSRSGRSGRQRRRARRRRARSRRLPPRPHRTVGRAGSAPHRYRDRRGRGRGAAAGRRRRRGTWQGPRRGCRWRRRSEVVALPRIGGEGGLPVEVTAQRIVPSWSTMPGVPTPTRGSGWCFPPDVVDEVVDQLEGRVASAPSSRVARVVSSPRRLRGPRQRCARRGEVMTVRDRPAARRASAACRPARAAAESVASRPAQVRDELTDAGRGQAGEAAMSARLIGPGRRGARTSARYGHGSARGSPWTGIQWRHVSVGPLATSSRKLTKRMVGCAPNFVNTQDKVGLLADRGPLSPDARPGALGVCQPCGAAGAP